MNLRAEQVALQPHHLSSIMARASIDKKKKTNQVEPTPESDAEAAVDQLLTGPATEASEEEEDEEGIFEVEKILKHRGKGVSIMSIS